MDHYIEREHHSKFVSLHPYLLYHYHNVNANEYGNSHAHYALIAILIGTNDYHLLNRQASPLVLSEKVELVIDRLTGAGAFAFLLIVPPNPFLYSETLSKPEDVTFINSYRRELTKLRIRLASRERKLKSALLDLHSLMLRITSNPSRFGFDDTSRQNDNGCLEFIETEGVKDWNMCGLPDLHIWWDRVSFIILRYKRDKLIECV